MPDFNTLETQIDLLKTKIDALTADALTAEDILYVSETLATLANSLGVDDIVAATADSIAQIQAAEAATIAVVEGTANGQAVVDLQNSYNTLQASYDNIDPRVGSIEGQITLQQSDIATATLTALSVKLNDWQVITDSHLAVDRDRLFVDPTFDVNIDIVISLPSAPDVGARIEVVDVSGDAVNNPFTVTKDPTDTIQGINDDVIFNINNGSIIFVYAGDYGWRIL